MRRSIVVAATVALLTTLFGSGVVLAVDPERARRATPDSIGGHRLEEPIRSAAVAPASRLDASLRSATGIRQVVVRLTADSVGEVAAAGGAPSAQRQAHGTVQAQQSEFLSEVGGAVLARTEVALNAVVLEVEAADLPALAADPRVVSISPVIDYEYNLPETVPWIGAAGVQADGVTGAGVKVAILDSGIDYTHAAFGGPGTPEAYDAAYGANTGDAANRDEPDWATIAAATNVVGGFDYVGEVWPFGVLAPDPDPIDCGARPVSPVPEDANAPTICEGGHGTHVADIVGGAGGVAPGVDLYAVKVCSAVSPACSGAALLLGMDFALDPNGDGDTTDKVDIINMSLGSPYGQARDDDLSFAVETATANGILTVAAAGNDSDKPYVSGSPAATPSALSVAQTAVPSARLTLLEVVIPSAIAGLYPAVFQPWSAPLAGVIEGPLQYGDGAGGNLDGCLPLAAGSAAGRVVLVDRGTCDFSLKIANIAKGGALAGIIGLIAPGEPFEGALGECPDDDCAAIPGFMIHEETSGALKDELGTVVTVRFDPADGLPLERTMVGSSSRGPTMLTNIVKPEIGAPGASVSAVAGAGTDTAPFGGTSGAAPMVTGSAALLLDALPERSPAEIKSLLMNYAETSIANGAPQPPINSPPAAIQRIGAGEVRVDRSLAGADAAAWDTQLQTAALSFGFVDAADATTELTREVTVANYGTAPRDYEIESSFRFGDDETNGAVSLAHPPAVTVPAASTDGPASATFDVTLTIDGAALRDWTLNSGSRGADGAIITELEYDGYISLVEAAPGDDPADPDPLHLAWHVLPRLSGETTASSATVTIDGEFDGLPAGEVTLGNAGVGPSMIEGYSLLGESPQLPPSPEGQNLPTIDLRYAGVQTIPAPAGLCLEEPSFLLLLSVNTWERQTHANAPASFEWWLDTSGDGEADYVAFTSDPADLSDGRNLTFVADLEANEASAFFFTDHATNSGNSVLIICAEQIGMTADDLGAPIGADLLAWESYFLGRYTDEITGMRFAPLGERYFPVVGDDGFGAGLVAPGAEETLHVQDYGPDDTNPGELGVLLFTDGTLPPDFSAKSGAPQANEAIAIRAQAPAPDPDPGPAPTPDPGTVPFTDIAGHPFAADITWAWQNGITQGCTATLFCPDNAVNREQMASFLVRAFDLPAASGDHFSDDEASLHEADINAVFEAGLASGCGGGRYCPSAPVTREQMASFLARALGLGPPAGDHFTDDEASIHEAHINALYEAGVTTGCGGTRYCPTQVVTRGQMTAFLHRAIE